MDCQDYKLCTGKLHAPSKPELGVSGKSQFLQFLITLFRTSLCNSKNVFSNCPMSPDYICGLLSTDGISGIPTRDPPPYHTIPFTLHTPYTYHPKSPAHQRPPSCPTTHQFGILLSHQYLKMHSGEKFYGFSPLCIFNIFNGGEETTLQVGILLSRRYFRPK